MTSISTLFSTSQWTSVPRPEQGDKGPLASVSSLLGSSVTELQSGLATGKSLDDIAGEKGVSHDDLIAALQEGQPADAPSGTQAPDGSASGVLTGSVTERQQTLLDQLSELLQTDSDDLVSELQGGADLAQMLADRGVTRADASSTLGEGFLLDTRA